MRKKELRVVITFQSTTSAMAMEKYCKEEHCSGRLIPVPRNITTGCGLAWSAKQEEKERLLIFMENHHIKYDNIYDLML